MSYGYDYDRYQGDAPHAADPGPQEDSAAGRGRRRKSLPEPEPSYDQHSYDQHSYGEHSYDQQPYDPQPYDPQPHDPQQYDSQPYDPQWEHSGLGWEQEAWNRAQQFGSDEYAAVGQDAVDQDDRYHSQYAEPAQERADTLFNREPGLEFDSAPLTEPEPDSTNVAVAAPTAAVGTNSTAATAAPTSSLSTVTAGRGAFGAAGLAVVTGIGAIAATPVLAVVIGLSQIGLAIGWTRSVGLPNARRTVVLVAAIGLAAAVLAYRLIPDRAPAAMGAALGVGFVFLAADQLFRKDTAAQWPRSEALAAAVAGAAFTVLPAGYLVAQRGDSALAGACALAAAVAVLCSALVGGGTRPAGILAAAVAGTAVGTLTAVSLGASAGSKGGAMGGLISGVFAVVGARTADRLANEGSDVRISAQALPMAFSAIGAVIAVQVVR